MIEYIILSALIILVALIIYRLIDLNNFASFLKEGVLSLIIAFALSITIFIHGGKYFISIKGTIFITALIIENVALYIMSLSLLNRCYFHFVLFDTLVTDIFILNPVVIKSSQQAIEFLREIGVDIEGKECRLVISENLFLWFIDNEHSITLDGYYHEEKLRNYEIIEIGNEIGIEEAIFELKENEGNLFLEEVFL